MPFIAGCGVWIDDNFDFPTIEEYEEYEGNLDPKLRLFILFVSTSLYEIIKQQVLYLLPNENKELSIGDFALISPLPLSPPLCLFDNATQTLVFCFDVSGM
jgi:hypothetical protein